jgi:hypothetical protein
MELGNGISPCGTTEKYRKNWEDRPIKLYNRFAKFLLTIPFETVTLVQISLGTPILPFISSCQTRCLSIFIQLSLSCVLDRLEPSRRIAAPDRRDERDGG